MIFYSRINTLDRITPYSKFVVSYCYINIHIWHINYLIVYLYSSILVSFVNFKWGEMHTSFINTYSTIITTYKLLSSFLWVLCYTGFTKYWYWYNEGMYSIVISQNKIWFTKFIQSCSIFRHWYRNRFSNVELDLIN